MEKRFSITEKPISIDEVSALMSDPAYGAVTIFQGVVRNRTGTRNVDHLEYDAYPEMAEEIMAQIADEVHDRWPEIGKVAIVHRIGRLEVGEVALVAAVSSPHREPTYDALRYIVNKVKESLPIWKKEVWEDGEAWIEGSEHRQVKTG